MVQYQVIRMVAKNKQKASKHYNRTVTTFSNIINNIHSIICKSADDGDDELEKFLKGL